MENIKLSKDIFSSIFGNLNIDEIIFLRNVSEIASHVLPPGELNWKACSKEPGFNYLFKKFHNSIILKCDADILEIGCGIIRSTNLKTFEIFLNKSFMTETLKKELITKFTEKVIKNCGRPTILHTFEVLDKYKVGYEFYFKTENRLIAKGIFERISAEKQFTSSDVADIICNLKGDYESLKFLSRSFITKELAGLFRHNLTTVCRILFCLIKERYTTEMINLISKTVGLSEYCQYLYDVDCINHIRKINIIVPTNALYIKFNEDTTISRFAEMKYLIRPQNITLSDILISSTKACDFDGFSKLAKCKNISRMDVRGYELFQSLSCVIKNWPLDKANQFIDLFNITKIDILKHSTRDKPHLKHNKYQEVFIVFGDIERLKFVIDKFSITSEELIVYGVDIIYDKIYVVMTDYVNSGDFGKNFESAILFFFEFFNFGCEIFSIFEKRFPEKLPTGYGDFKEKIAKNSILPGLA
jgi:hypothetical protein